MERNKWDYSNPNPVPAAAGTKKSGGRTAKYKQKIGEALEKAVASIAVKKVKEGISVGFQRIKDKYHKTTQKHKNQES
ncbi:CDP-diacylglycerol-glycerol-3-phosphate 3-phosphatidyltransferase [Fagus crenata]